MPKISITVRPSVEKVINALSKQEERSFSQMAAILIDDGIKGRVIPFIQENKKLFKDTFVNLKKPNNKNQKSK